MRLPMQHHLLPRSWRGGGADPSSRLRPALVSARVRPAAPIRCRARGAGSHRQMKRRRLLGGWRTFPVSQREATALRYPHRRTERNGRIPSCDGVFVGRAELLGRDAWPESSASSVTAHRRSRSLACPRSQMGHRVGRHRTGNLPGHSAAYQILSTPDQRLVCPYSDVLRHLRRLWARYLARGRRNALLSRPWAGIPIPLAVFLVLTFAFAAGVGSLPMASRRDGRTRCGPPHWELDQNRPGLDSARPPTRRSDR